MSCVYFSSKLSDESVKSWRISLANCTLNIGSAISHQQITLDEDAPDRERTSLAQHTRVPSILTVILTTVDAGVDPKETRVQLTFHV